MRTKHELLELREQAVALRRAGKSRREIKEILGVGNVYWSGSLTDYIYMVPEVMGKPAAIVPAALKTRFGG